MMGQNSGNQNRLFYSFNLDDHVPANHLLRGINQFFDLADLRAYLAPFYSHTGRPSIDPELMIRMLIVGYCFGIARSGDFAKRCTLTWHIVGSAGWGSRMWCRAFDVLEEPTRSLPRERCVPPCV